MIKGDFMVLTGCEFFDLVPDSGEGPELSFSGMIGADDFGARIKKYKIEGWELLNIGWFPNQGCEILFKRIEE